MIWIAVSLYLLGAIRFAVETRMVFPEEKPGPFHWDAIVWGLSWPFVTPFLLVAFVADLVESRTP